MSAIQSLKRTPMTLVLAMFALSLHMASGLQSWFSLNFHEFSVLDLHRVLTCHWLHWSTDQLVWDLAVFVILGTLCERKSAARYAWTVLMSALAIPLCVMVWLPQIDSYRGLSGIDTALFGLLTAELLFESIKDRDGTSMIVSGLFLVSLFGKIAIELISSTNIFVSDTSFVPVPVSHLIGAMIGLAIGSFARIQR